MNYNKRLGDFGEFLARGFLERRGYKIIETNVKIGYQEIDIIAIKKEFLVFVEVKTRISGGPERADEAMTEKKLKSLLLAVEQYLYKNNISQKNIELDLISVELNRVKKLANIKHYKNIA